MNSMGKAMLVVVGCVLSLGSHDPWSTGKPGCLSLSLERRTLGNVSAGFRGSMGSWWE